jgi:hypothetical protein
MHNPGALFFITFNCDKSKSSCKIHHKRKKQEKKNLDLCQNVVNLRKQKLLRTERRELDLPRNLRLAQKFTGHLNRLCMKQRNKASTYLRN